MSEAMSDLRQPLAGTCMGHARGLAAWAGPPGRMRAAALASLAAHVAPSGAAPQRLFPGLAGGFLIGSTLAECFAAGSHSIPFV